MNTTMQAAGWLAANASGPHWGPGWGGGWFFPLFPLLWLAIVGTVVWLIVRRSRANAPDGLERARSLLAERYANGELSTDEYRERAAQLR